MEHMFLSPQSAVINFFNRMHVDVQSCIYIGLANKPIQTLCFVYPWMCIHRQSFSTGPGECLFQQPYYEKVKEALTPGGIHCAQGETGKERGKEGKGREKGRGKGGRGVGKVRRKNMGWLTGDRQASRASILPWYFLQKD